MSHWFNLKDKGAKLDALNKTYSQLERDNEFQHSIFQDLLQAYSGIAVDENFLPSHLTWITDRLGGAASLNVTRQAVDTLISKIGKNKPRTKILTSDADYFLYEKGRKLEKFADGVYSNLDIHAISRNEVLLSALVLGTGCWKVYPFRGDIKVSNIWPWNIYVDKRDGKDKKPCQLMEVSKVAREVLIANYPKSKKAIESASSPFAQDGIAEVYDEIEVREIWHLPSGEDKDDGEYNIWIEDDTLFSAPYKEKTFPHVFYRWANIPYQFWGQGVPEILMSLQVKLNTVSEAIDTALEFAVPWVMTEENSNVNLDHIGNENMLLLQYSGPSRPEVVPQNPVPMNLINEREEVYRKAFETIGLSELSVAAKKPSGLDAAVALQEYSDIETERFATPILNWEAAHIEVTKRLFSSAKLIAENPKYKEYRTNIKGEVFFESVSWSDVNVDEDMYMMSLHPASALPTTPAGKLSKVSEMLKAGLISPEEGRELILEIPDIERLQNEENAYRKIIRKQVGIIVATGVMDLVPEPFDNHSLCVKIATNAYHQAREDEAPEEVLEALRNYISTANEFIQQRESEMQAQMMEQMRAEAETAQISKQPALATQATPMTQPQSSLLSQV